MATTAIVEHWAGLNHAEERIPIANTSELEAALRALAAAESATLTLEAADKSLIIGASDGVYCATAILGPDDFFDMVGNAAETGTISFVQGGQQVDLPRNQALTAEEAISVATEFFQTGSVNVERRWQKQ
jgi:hypothetical protein